jgi:glyoxylate reductase
MPRVLITRPIPGSIDLPSADVRVAPDPGFRDPAELREWLAAEGPADALVTMFHDPVDEATLDAAGDSLRAVVNFAVGYDNIDVPACAKRNVLVCNTPDAVTEGTADLAWALMLACARRLTEVGRFVRSGGFAKAGPLGMGDFLGLDLAGRTLLIVGAGRIGYATALRSLGWGMKVLYVARSRHFEFEFAPLNAERVELDAGLERADFVSVHTPLTAETHHLIDARRLALMKPRAVLVNTSRGSTVDERALVDALRSRQIFAAGLDVYENEPDLAPGLAELDNAVLTPHIGSGAGRYRELMTEIVMTNVRAALEGKTPPNLVESSA